MLLLNVYRPPSSSAETDTSLATCIENVLAQNKECFVLRDFNINTLYVRSRSNRLLKSIHSLGLSQMVDKPTRVDVNNSTKGPVMSTSLIDHIYLSHVHNIVHVSDVTLSDHYPVFVMRRCNAGLWKRKNAHTTINYKSLKNFDQKKFKEDLAQAPWSIIESFDNPSDALDTWYNIYNSTVDLRVPRRVKRVKSLMLPKWMDKSILASIRTRNWLKKSVTNAVSWLEYKTYRNKVTFQIRKAKKRFYANLIEENKWNSKMLWKVLKSSCKLWGKRISTNFHQ